MPTSSQTAALIARYTLTPGVGVGPLRFGDRVTQHPQLVVREPSLSEDGDELGDDDDDDCYAEYAIAGLDEFMVVYVDGDGRIDSVGFYEFCLVDGRDLIGMGVGELLVRLGIPTSIEADSFGPDADLLYAYAGLGLTLWTIDGEVCVVHAGLGES